MDAVIRGTTMPVLEVHLTPGESVVAETGRLGWFDDGVAGWSSNGSAESVVLSEGIGAVAKEIGKLL